MKNKNTLAMVGSSLLLAAAAVLGCENAPLPLYISDTGLYEVRSIEFDQNAETRKADGTLVRVATAQVVQLQKGGLVSSLHFQDTDYPEGDANSGEWKITDDETQKTHRFEASADFQSYKVNDGSGALTVSLAPSGSLVVNGTAYSDTKAYAKAVACSPQFRSMPDSTLYLLDSLLADPMMAMGRGDTTNITPMTRPVGSNLNYGGARTSSERQTKLPAAGTLVGPVLGRAQINCNE